MELRNEDSNLNFAFYTLKRVNFGKTTNMITASMMPNHMGVRSAIEPNSVVIGNSYSSHPICDIIQDIPPHRNALHDIHYRFEVPDIWNIL